VYSSQIETGNLEASAATILNYNHAVVDGFLQVREYARLVLAMAGLEPRAISRAVDDRMRRQSILLDQSKRFELVMTEAALRWRPGSVQLQIDQLRQISTLMALPNIRVGVLPLSGQARVLYPEGFQIYADRGAGADTLVVVELVTDEVSISETASVALYQQEFSQLRAAALHGQDARDLLERIVADLNREEPRPPETG
jgi:hypothetical protein